ncbi:MAG: DNA polymerase III subunit alpha [Gammaproteobacteria bacterium]|nr:DNA polymerase III subunit alpha [Gammaproteobacteria bacterium]
MPSFVHLRVHTEYSLVDGLVRVKPLVKAAAAGGMPAVAVTDQNNLFALVQFYKAAQGAGVKPIAGADVWLDNPADPAQPYRLVLLCKDKAGYLNLSRLVSRSYTEGQQHGRPMLQREWLTGNVDGLIVLSGGSEGDVGRALLAGHRDQAAELLTGWLRLFGDNYYLELTRTGRPGEEDYLHEAVGLAAMMGVPVVATNDVRFLKPGEFEAHEARVCIHDGRVLDDPRRPRRYTEQQYLRSPEEMAELFADIPEAIENTVEIARRCNVELTLGKYFLPDFPVPDGLTMDEFFRREAREGLERRLAKLFDPAAPDFAAKRKPYDERLEIELNVIIQMGFPGYFLIVADFIQWAKRNGIPVGPGRGSGAGSLVAYALMITDLDPLPYDLLFERFLNPERVSMPDFDVDFCMEGRDRVIDYVADHYGREKVSQIITYGTMAAKAVVRDVGRVMGHPYGFVDQIAKLIPFELGITLEEALKKEEQLRERYEKEDDVHALIDMALQLEGITRNAGKHAGGVVIAPSQLTDFAPLYCEAGGHNVVTQFDKNDVESVGLVKFDFLGLRTLTIIDWALQNIAQATGKTIDISAIPLNDKPSYDLLKACQTTAVFQLESRGMKDLIRRLQPDCFEDIIALVALFRPGPLESGMVDDFINRKHGRAAVEFPFPELETILGPTYGVIVYQEQVMQISQVVGGYTLGGADLLRRAMGKKKPEEMAKQRSTFLEGAGKLCFDLDKAGALFDLMEKFAGYGFNKSHSAAYALVSYQTMWLKAHYPAAFMAAVLSADMDNTDKVVTLIEECRAMDLEVVPPSVNTSAHKFTVREGTVVYGLGAIKGVGEQAIAGIVEERLAKGPFRDLFDFCRRIDLKKANRRVLEALIRAGALDGLGANRATLMAALPQALKLAEQDSKNSEAGLGDLFGFDSTVLVDSPATYDPVPEWDEDFRLQGEKETLGLYLTGHPINQYLDELKRFTSCRIADLKPQRKQNVVVAGLVVGVRTMQNKRGDRMGFVTLDDRSGRIEIAAFAEAYQRFRDQLVKDRVLVVEGEVNQDEYSGGLRMQASEIYDIDQARERYARRIVLRLDEAAADNGLLTALEKALSPFREGRCPIRVHYRNRTAQVPIDLGETWNVRPAQELLQRLRHLLGEENVRLEYGDRRAASAAA